MKKPESYPQKNKNYVYTAKLYRIKYLPAYLTFILLVMAISCSSPPENVVSIPFSNVVGTYDGSITESEFQEEVLVSLSEIEGVIVDVSLVNTSSIKVSDSQNKFGERIMTYVGEVSNSGDKNHLFTLSISAEQSQELYYSPLMDTIYLSETLIDGIHVEKTTFQGEK